MNAVEQEIVQCVKCGARNRVPVDRLESKGKCGRCGAELPKVGQDGRSEFRILRCSECAAKNRLGTDRLNAHPKCGKCGAPLRTADLFEPQPFMISDWNFTEKVLKSPLPVLVYAMSPLCPGCGTVSPHIDAFAREIKGLARVGRLDIQQSPALASKFGILSVPSLLLFDRGELIQSMPGGLDKEGLKKFMSPYLYTSDPS